MNLVYRKIILSFLLMFSFSSFSQGSESPQFQDYFVKNSYTGKPAKVVLSTEETRMFRTRLRAASKESVNFSGEYVITTWGCGTSCMHGAAVSLRTGHVVFLPGTVCCWYGDGDNIMYRTNSRLFIAAGLINEACEHGAHFYEFTGREFKHIKTIPIAEQRF